MDNGQTRLNGAPTPEQDTPQTQSNWEQVSAMQFGAAENTASSAPERDPNRMGEIISVEPTETEPQKDNIIDFSAAVKARNAAPDTSELVEDPKTKNIGKAALKIVFAAERQMLSGDNPGEAYNRVRDISVGYTNNSFGAASAARELDANQRKAA